MMKILTEKSVLNDIERLDRAWESENSFVFLSDKSGVGKDWIEHAVSTFPTQFHKNHFENQLARICNPCVFEQALHILKQFYNNHFGNPK